MITKGLQRLLCIKGGSVVPFNFLLKCINHSVVNVPISPTIYLRHLKEDQPLPVTSPSQRYREIACLCFWGVLISVQLSPKTASSSSSYLIIRSRNHTLHGYEWFKKENPSKFPARAFIHEDFRSHPHCRVASGWPHKTHQASRHYVVNKSY